MYHSDSCPLRLDILIHVLTNRRIYSTLLFLFLFLFCFVFVFVLFVGFVFVLFFFVLLCFALFCFVFVCFVWGGGFVFVFGLFVCLRSQQHARVFQGRICQTIVRADTLR